MINQLLLLLRFKTSYILFTQTLNTSSFFLLTSEISYGLCQRDTNPSVLNTSIPQLKTLSAAKESSQKNLATIKTSYGEQNSPHKTFYVITKEHYHTTSIKIYT